METEAKNYCAVCKKISERRCSACQAVYYCSVEHQKIDWKVHSRNCRAYKLVGNPRLGRYYVATRDIEVGERVMWEDSPLLIVPTYMKITYAPRGPSTIKMTLDSHPQCLNCYIELTDAIARECKKCGWLLCHLCTTHGDECDFTIKHRKMTVKLSDTEFGRPHKAYSVIPVARALALRDNDPESYRRLMRLQGIPRTRARKQIPECIDKTARYALEFFNIQDIELAEISKIYEILLVNSHLIKSGKHEYVSLYGLTSFIEHNCRANCSKTLTKTGGIVFNAALPISKGDHISTCYVRPFMGTLLRKEHLLVTKFFDCNCERCEDPTEFGTMYNAIKCPKLRCEGYSLPALFSPSPRTPSMLFSCSHCSEMVAPTLLHEMNQRMVRVTATLSDNVVECQDLVKKMRPLFHPNNHFLVDVEWSMLRAYVKIIDDLEKRSEEELADIVNVCRKLTDLFRIITPAETKARASILCLKFQVTRLLNRKKLLNADQTIASIEECQEDLNEIYQLLSPEPIESIEYGTAVTMCRLLRELEEFKKSAPQLHPATLKNIWIIDNFTIR